MNLHPRSAMAWREGATPDDYLGFYDQTMTEV
jgi:4-hydroxy 2-oxovalerate aldolase